MKRLIAPFTIAVLLGVSGFAHGFAAEAPPGDANAGAKIVADHGCMGCHGAKFQGGMAPKLFGIEHRRTMAQIAAAIKQPRAPMPDYGLNERQTADVVAYLSSLDGGLKGDLPVITLDPATPRDQANITVRFPGAVPKHVVARASMNMGTTSHHRDSELHPTKDPHVWEGVVYFSMGGAWTLTVMYDEKTIDMPLTVSGGT